MLGKAFKFQLKKENQDLKGGKGEKDSKKGKDAKKQKEEKQKVMFENEAFLPVLRK